MFLSDEQITEFQMLNKKHFGTDIDKKMAHEKGLRLIRLMDIILKNNTRTSSAQINQN